MLPIQFPRLCVGLVTAGVVAGLALRTDAAVIDLQASAQVRTGIIRLADIAEIDDADPLLQRELSAVSLGPAPAEGRKVRLTQQAIRQRLLAHGTNLSEIEFTGQSVVIVTGLDDATDEKLSALRSGNPLGLRPLPVNPALQKKADDLLQRAFHRHYHSAGSDVGSLELKIEIPADDFPHILNADPQRIRFVEPGLEWGGPQKLTAQIPQSDGSTRVVPLQVWLNEAPRILTVKHAVPKGKLIKESDLTRISAKNGETGLEQDHELIGQEAVRDLRPGQPLRSQDVTQAELVRANDLVTVKVREPGLTVSRVFRASGGGGAGEVINLVALEDQREKIQATVTGWHEAEMTSPALRNPPPQTESRRRGRRAPVSEADSFQGGRP